MNKINMSGMYPVYQYVFDVIKRKRKVEKINKSSNLNNYNNDNLGNNNEQNINKWSCKSL